jgi:hypothetical protein
MTYGGIGSMLLLVRKLGLADAIDRRLHLLKIHLPFWRRHCASPTLVWTWRSEALRLRFKLFDASPCL